MEDFILRIFLAGVGVAIVAGALGCFVIWKRMSYFSESISHSALLGVSLGLIGGLDIYIGLLVVNILFAILVVFLQQKQFLSNDAILGIFSHIALSLGIVVLSLTDGKNVDYFSLLFGDILSVSSQDIVWIYAVVILVLVILKYTWQRLLLLTLNEDLAIIQGVGKLTHQLLLMLMIALVVAVSVRIVGVLLITSLLIIPPAIAKPFAKTPQSMLWRSVVSAVLSVIVGIGLSMNYDLAAGPMIVITLGGLFLLTQLPTRSSK
jgi:zinc transport system permease protein